MLLRKNQSSHKVKINSFCITNFKILKITKLLNLNLALITMLSTLMKLILSMERVL